MDGIRILMSDAETKGMYDPANFCILKNNLIEPFEGSTLQVKSLEFKFSEEDLSRTAVEVCKKRIKKMEKAANEDDNE
eukprot:m.297690 g.297690  ORF g.297690 m.297690 type:complete len:78 (+) comp20086_c0_seq2:452-685(+)